MLVKTVSCYRSYGSIGTLRKIAKYSSRKCGCMGRLLCSVVLRVIGDDTYVIPLLEGKTFVQAVNVNVREISSVEVLFSTYGRTNTSTNEIVVLDGQGELLFKGEIRSQDVVDNEYHVIRFDEPIVVTGRRRIYIGLSSTDGRKGNCVAFWIERNPLSSLYSLDNGCRESGLIPIPEDATFLPPWERMDGDVRLNVHGRLELVTYHRPDLPDALEKDVGDKVSAHILLLSRSTALYKALRDTSGVHVSGTVRELQRALSGGEVDVLILSGTCDPSCLKGIVEHAFADYVPIVYLLMESDIVDRDMRHDVLDIVSLCDCMISPGDMGRDIASLSGKKCFVMGEEGKGISRLLGEVWKYHRRCVLPKVSIISILYKKSEEIGFVIKSYFDQTYRGDIEIVFVDDFSPDDSRETALECMIRESERRSHGQREIDYRLVVNERNMGNCYSRNAGIREATGDIVVVVDADCMMNRDFILRHVEAHSFDDCDVVIGPYNIDAGGADPVEVMGKYESHPYLVCRDADLQDRKVKRSFLNCITRNFSIKKASIGDDLFDERFSYSSASDSGYGWEDVEMGYRLYLKGARIKFIDDAFTVHISSNDGEGGGAPARSLRNFRRLYEKHSELGWVARRWSCETYGKIKDWMESEGCEKSEDNNRLDSYFSSIGCVRLSVGKKRRLRVLSYRWHVPHQYELYKLPVDVTLVTGLGTPMTEYWEYRQRPIPENVRFSRIDDVDQRDFDVAILHFDENVLSPENTNGVIGDEWGASFKWFRENVDLPMVAVCHGTPQFRGQYDIGYSSPDLMDVMEEERARIVDYMGSIPIVVNSYQALEEWGFNNARVIWHGFDPVEFPPATYERGIVSPCGPLVTSRPHYRGYFLYKDVRERLPSDIDIEDLYVPDPHFSYKGNAYANMRFNNYVDAIRKYSVYFNPTIRSPMPRARCEPMMCGVVTVNAKNHDVERFIINGKNGFYSNDAGELADILTYLSRNRSQVERIGKESRKTALELFNIDRYLSDWDRLLETVV